MELQKNKTEICPLCNANSLHKYLRSHIDKQTNINYDLFLCSSCDAQHWSPMKNPGGEWYEKDERYANRNIDPTIIPGIQHIAAIKRMKNIGVGNILDVGCGNGNFLAYAKKFGFIGEGFDFDRDGIESGKRAFGLTDLFVDDLKNYKIKNSEKKFNWVTFFDVFEHIDNHNDFINDVKSFLNDNGHIAMSIPHRDSASWLIPGDLPPRHLTRWSPTSIENFLKVRGFDNVIVILIPATIDFLVTKFRWKYGKHFNFGLVGKIKQKEAKETYKNEQGNVSYIPKKSLKVKIVHAMAKLKDYILFGIPALLVFISMLGAKQRYTDMVIIARLPKKG